MLPQSFSFLENNQNFADSNFDVNTQYNPFCSDINTVIPDVELANSFQMFDSNENDNDNWSLIPETFQLASQPTSDIVFDSF